MLETGKLPNLLSLYNRVILLITLSVAVYLAFKRQSVIAILIVIGGAMTSLGGRTIDNVGLVWFPVIGQWVGFARVR